MTPDPEPLPTFRYHPDPIGTGSVELSDKSCACCGHHRGYIYTGPVYAEEEHNEDICPWCIADGTAHEKFDAEFIDAAGVGGYGDWDSVPDSISDEVAHRTPGFTGWQQEKWFTHCGDAAAFLGRAGKSELLAFGAQAVEAIRAEVGWSGKEWDDYFQSLDKDGQPTAYIFCCLHCGRFGGYSDFT